MKTLLFLIPLTVFAAGPAGLLNMAVHRELVMLPQYTVFDNLSYRIDGATVTLAGQVTQPVTRTNAEKAVKNLPGVRAVENTIEVLPVSPNDDRIRLAAYRAIYSQEQLQRYQLNAVPPIHIIVKNGNLTLEGVVLNQFDRSVAEITANTVSGVYRVINHLRTEQAAKTSK
jgi:hyperosmotically inducible protein